MCFIYIYFWNRKMDNPVHVLMLWFNFKQRLVEKVRDVFELNRDVSITAVISLYLYKTFSIIIENVSSFFGKSINVCVRTTLDGKFFRYAEGDVQKGFYDDLLHIYCVGPNRPVKIYLVVQKYL